jgi:hypothetical protein
VSEKKVLERIFGKSKYPGTSQNDVMSSLVTYTLHG